MTIDTNDVINIARLLSGRIDGIPKGMTRKQYIEYLNEKSLEQENWFQKPKSNIKE